MDVRQIQFDPKSNLGSKRQSLLKQAFLKEVGFSLLCPFSHLLWAGGREERSKFRLM
ncbi:MAG: hypothetical protein NZ805_11045 [Armatimonadetes bacterium]|nr:hypothetical protein [Armatimonadota bacterium]MDW8029318.1 hypothetical protein [Armatimonadota bacterium]